jgi:hypothetical protein
MAISGSVGIRPGHARQSPCLEKAPFLIAMPWLIAAISGLFTEAPLR